MKPVNVALIGAGRWGRNWFRVLSELESVRLRWVCDTSPESLRAAGTDTTDEADRVLADTSVEAVVIATPSSTHATLACRALEAGKHVLVEKPLALSLGDAERVQAAAHRVGRRVLVGHILLHHPAIHRLARELEGPVRSFSSERSVLPVAGRTEDAWWTLGCHDISLLRYLIGGDPVDISVNNAGPGTPAEVVRARLGFGARSEAVVDLSCVARRKLRRLTVVTDSQRIVLEDRGAGDVTLRMGVGTPERIPVESEPLRVEAQDFALRIRDGSPSVTEIDEAMAVMRVLDAGARSMARGGAVLDLAPAPRTKAV